MINLKVHPLCGAVAIPENSIRKTLADSIRDEGLREPITLFQGMILDGKDRYQLGMKLALSRFEFSDEDFTVFTGTWAEAAEFVRARFLATLDRRMGNYSPALAKDATAKTLARIDAAAADPLPDPPAADLPAIPPSHASLMAAFDTLERRALAFLGNEVAAYTRGRRPKAHDRILAVITRAHDLAGTITDAQMRKFLENPPG